MSNVITREYLVNRFVSITAGQMSLIHEKVMDALRDTDTAETYERKFSQAVRAEEDRQIKAGIAKRLEQNMKHNNQARTINPDTGIVDCTA